MHQRRLQTLIAGMAILAMLPLYATAQQGHSPAQATPAAATPAAIPNAGWQVEDVKVADVAGVPVAISPDGTMLAGIGPDDTLCVWDIATLEPTCDAGSSMSISPDSIVWSPDGSAVAFTEDMFMNGYESDIHVYELATGERVNLTDDDLEGGMLSFGDAPSVPLDAVPTWEAGSQSLLFVRSDMGGDREVVPTDLMRIDRAGGEPEQVATLLDDAPLAVYSSMFVLGDGSLVYTLAPSEIDHPDNGIWVLSPAGDAVKVLDGTANGDIPIPMITSVHETQGKVQVAGVSAYNLGQVGEVPAIAFVLDLEIGGDSGPRSNGVTWLNADDETMAMPTLTAISPDGGTLLSVLAGPPEIDQVQLEGAEHVVVDLGFGGEATESGGGPRWRGPQWTESGIVFVPRGNVADPYILTMTQESST